MGFMICRAILQTPLFNKYSSHSVGMFWQITSKRWLVSDRLGWAELLPTRNQD